MDFGPFKSLESSSKHVCQHSFPILIIVLVRTKSRKTTTPHVFFFTPKDLATVHYVTIDDAIRLIKSLGKGCFLAKTDKSAFRIIPVAPGQLLQDHRTRKSS